MKLSFKINLILGFAFILSSIGVNAQMYNSGDLYNASTGIIYNGSDLNNTSTGTLNNIGNYHLKGNFTNDGSSGYNLGKIWFSGTALQTISGTTTFQTTDLELNNSAGFACSTTISIDGVLTFTNGLVATSSSSTPVQFTSTGTHSGASNASHINGFVRKLGTGSFTYPVGDATNFQKVDINLSANASGMGVKYFPTDAGNVGFGLLGSSLPDLRHYNNNEYWDLSPVSTATGTVTIHWDSYNNPGITSVSHLRVAHLTSGAWQNEGTSGSGTVALGSVTSTSLSTWSPFTLGSINDSSPLPVEILRFEVYPKNNGKTADLQWITSMELNNRGFEIQRKLEGESEFKTIGWMDSKAPDGNSNQQLSYNLDNDLSSYLGNSVYYRLKQFDFNGKFEYSQIRKLNLAKKSVVEIKLFPNPANEKLNIQYLLPESGMFAIKMVDVSGKELLNYGSNNQKSKGLNTETIDVSNLAQGIYYLQTIYNGEVKVNQFIKR